MANLAALFWAAAITTPAAIAGFCVLIFAKDERISVVAAAFLAGFIRLLLTFTGSAIIIHFVPVTVLQFVLWLMILYFMSLSAEVYFSLWIIDRFDRQRLTTFDSDRNFS